METRHVALFVPIMNDGRIVLQKRHSIHKLEKELDFDYGFFGGGIESNESSEEALVREVKEELTYDLITFHKLGTFTGNYGLFNYKVHLFYEFFNDLKKFIVQEGDGLYVVNFEDAQKLHLSEPDKKFLKSLRAQLESKP